MLKATVAAPRCLVYPTDRAAMRLASAPRISSSNLCSTAPFRRQLHATGVRSIDPVVFRNSLEKTLEAHRSSNRASLIRKVINDKCPAGISPPIIPLEHHAGHDEPLPKVSSVSSAEPQSLQSLAPARRAQRKARSSSQVAAPHPQTANYPQLQWHADEARGRPEQRPWLKYLTTDCKTSDAISRLDAEIRALEVYMTPTPSEQGEIDRLVADVRRLLAGIVPSPPQVTGSWRTRFALSHSDLDFVLPVPDSDRSTRGVRKPSATRPKVLQTYKKLLRDVGQVLQQCPSFGGRVRVLGNRFPVLSAIHRPTGRLLQFHCGEGLPASVEYIMDYQAEYPSTRPLYVTARLILEARGRYGRPRLSIGSDALVMLLVAFLKMNHGRFQRPDCLGEQLIAFLRAYGTDVDLTTTGVSVDPPSWFNASTVKRASALYAPDDLPAHLRGQRSLISLKRTAAARRNLSAASRLCVQDPTNYMNDLGRSCVRTSELQGAFSLAHDRLGASLRHWDDSEQAPDASILTRALQANFHDFENLRAKSLKLNAS
ncbi:hypothetical protein Asppvi_006114 [Aspergillus pseudoviridinutans]|uniref:Polynucleotide adenylyltransferase n=1 Tax=Aspergillus pseudoviridinutans TaxID=1517512 RepID=A0A9P3BDL5_9EURO|nr:uncharacterized protein Asppvi_006114 [Aspergillus pseudoviridinutans]GIJ87208.1 hypothetical protein Asppvi_006114 [Aspergillus pseudoviridinutans]